VRGRYLAEMEQFLFKPGGTVLDFGCGTGWVGLRLAQKGMSLVGIDLSGEQIARAWENARRLGVSSAWFIQGGTDQIREKESYDGVILHALLHHLSNKEKGILFRRLDWALVTGGRIYAYEPIAARPNPPLSAWLVDKGLLLLLHLLRILVYRLNIQEPDVREAIQEGWTMQSPNEAPIRLERLLTFLPEALTITGITYWHMSAVAYANLSMGLCPRWRKVAIRLMPLFLAIDTFVLQKPWRFYLKAWPMAGIRMQKGPSVQAHMVS